MERGPLAGSPSVPLVRRNSSFVAACLGILALSFNALVPIHLVFDLADAPDAAGEEHAGHGHHGDGWLAMLVGHRDAGGGQGHERHVNCAVCNTIGALAGLAPAAGTALPIPVVVDAPVALVERIGNPSRAFPASYRSRAPPNG